MCDGSQFEKKVLISSQTALQVLGARLAISPQPQFGRLTIRLLQSRPHRLLRGYPALLTGRTLRGRFRKGLKRVCY